jgi:hypothetical protein
MENDCADQLKIVVRRKARSRTRSHTRGISGLSETDDSPLAFAHELFNAISQKIGGELRLTSPGFSISINQDFQFSDDYSISIAHSRSVLPGFTSIPKENSKSTSPSISGDSADLSAVNDLYFHLQCMLTLANCICTYHLDLRSNYSINTDYFTLLVDYCDVP